MANMNNKRKTVVGRFDTEFVKEMKELAKFRYMKNLEKKEPSFSEMQRLLKRTDGWKISREELMKKPRRENL